jgi:hypothetical protein
MIDICQRLIDHPSAWTAVSLGGKAGISYALNSPQLAAFDEVLARTRRKKPQEATRQDFDHPILKPLMAELFELIQNGRGAVIITGVMPERFSREEMERIYWGFGTHWGIAATQSSLGDKLGHVKYAPIGPDNPTGRAYRSMEELHPHTDNYEIVGLMCLDTADSGGLSHLTSSLAVHNEILRHHSEFLEPLYRGYPYASREAAQSKSPVTPYDVPVFCYVDGKVSCQIVTEFIRQAARKQGVALPKELSAALEYFEELTARDDITLKFLLEPGEMMIINNFTVLHSRTAFKNSAAKERHLLRLWLDVPHGRKVIPVYHRQGEGYGNPLGRVVPTEALA